MLAPGHAGHRLAHRRRKEGQGVHVESVAGGGQHVVDEQFGKPIAPAAEAQLYLVSGQPRLLDAAGGADGNDAFDALT
ncbi:hypothetical protein O1M63_49790 [Streptomyces mirabilis]|nr:hypothetical protein [Streptomyces mirabilis]